ncbi:MAG: hypothetical protein KDD14_10405, partial [Saprospiraceae bacterium]|nr:hypothetical protein [Saprospiraceae bacterium]
IDSPGALDFPDYVSKWSRERDYVYHYPARQYFEAAGISFDREGNVKNSFEQAGKPGNGPAFKPPKPAPAKPVSFIPPDLFRGGLKSYGNNNLAKFLSARLGRETAETLVARYYVGTSNQWPGANVFWQVDSRGKVRSGKVMLYDPETGRRDKQKKPTWAHAVLKLPGFNLQQCFFGEHLLAQNPGKTVAIVESEKTALIASAYLEPKGFVWLASGGLGMLKAERCTVLQGRQIVLYPDAGLPHAQDGKMPFEKWSIEADKLRQAGYRVSVSELLEQKATPTEREKGFDLADYLLRFDFSEFRQIAAQAARQTQPEPPRETETTAPALLPGYERRTYTDGTTGEPIEVLLNADGYPAEWDLEEPQREALVNIIQQAPIVSELITRFELQPIKQQL